MKNVAYMLVATNDMVELRKVSYFKDAHIFWKYQGFAGIIGVEVERGADLPLVMVQAAVGGHLQVLPSLGDGPLDVSAYVNEDTHGLGLKPCFLRPRAHSKSHILGNIVLFKATKSGLSCGFTKCELLNRMDLAPIFRCYKEYSDGDFDVDRMAKRVDIGSYIRKKEVFGKRLSYSVVFHVNDRDKFMNGIGGQIIEYMKNNSSEEIGAVVDMAGFTNLVKYRDYSDFVESYASARIRGDDLPDFETWVRAGEPREFDKNCDYSS